MSIVKLFYKNLIFENTNKLTKVYSKHIKKYQILNNKYISYNKKEYINNIEFPQKRIPK